MEPDRRSEILNFIKSNPGYYFRELQRSLKLPTGVLQYHLNNLIKEGEITSEDINGTKCFFPAKSFSRDQIIALSHLRNHTRNRIVRLLLSGEPKSPSEIIKDLKISSPTLSYHLSLLTQDNVLERVQMNRGIGYRIKDIESIKGLIIEYRESFLDKLIQDFIEIWMK